MESLSYILDYNSVSLFCNIFLICVGKVSILYHLLLPD